MGLNMGWSMGCNMVWSIGWNTGWNMVWNIYTNPAKRTRLSRGLINKMIRKFDKLDRRTSTKIAT